MPVIGHAFVGLATADIARPSRGSPARLAFWTPIVVGLAYLPDVAGQGVALAGRTAWVPLCHSVVLALPAALLVAVALSRLLKVSFSRCVVVAPVSVLAHDLLDLAAGGHHLSLWWPLSDRRIHLGDEALSMVREIVIFGSAYLAFLGLRWLRCRALAPHLDVAGGSAHRSRLVWLGGAVTGLILMSAAGTHHLRELREKQLQLAWRHIGEKRHTAALALLDQAERWPATARPGRIDYARAEAWAAAGDRDRAERYYLRSYRADPSCFWTVADLAVFYASSDDPIEVRRARAEPYRQLLTTEFAGEQALPRCLARLARKLADSTIPSAASSASPPAAVSISMSRPG